MNEEKAIEFLKNKTINYSLSGEELHYYLILYYLIINLQKENQKLKEKLKASERARKEAIEFIKEYEKNQNLLKWNEEDYIDVINEIKKYLDIDKGE